MNRGREMDDMIVKAIKLTKDPISTKIVYEKNGTLYIRDGSTGFAKGRKVSAPLRSLLSKWGFREVENGPIFRNGEEISQSLHRFEMGENGRVSFIQ